MRSDAGASNPNDTAAATLKFQIYWILPQQTAGEIMTTHITQNACHPASAQPERIQDLLLVSSFALWAALLGLAPVLVYRLLMVA